MELVYTVGEPTTFSQEQRDNFLSLLIEQDQVGNPTMEKINKCRYLCMIRYNETAIGIGAIKRSGKTAFTKSGMADLAGDYNNELGYVYVREEKLYEDLGIGKSISKLLVKQVAGEKIFASTAVGNDASSMIWILKSLKFEQIGKPYKGGKTEKEIALFIRPIPKNKSNETQVSQ